MLPTTFLLSFKKPLLCSLRSSGYIRPRWLFPSCQDGRPQSPCRTCGTGPWSALLSLVLAKETTIVCKIMVRATNVHSLSRSMHLKKIPGSIWTQHGKSFSPAEPCTSLPHMFSHWFKEIDSTWNSTEKLHMHTTIVYSEHYTGTQVGAWYTGVCLVSGKEASKFSPLVWDSYSSEQGHSRPFSPTVSLISVPNPT